MMLVRMNQREFTTESNRTRLSIIRFCMPSSGASAFNLNNRPYLITLLQQYLIVLAESYTEND